MVGFSLAGYIEDEGNLKPFFSLFLILSSGKGVEVILKM